MKKISTLFVAFFLTVAMAVCASAAVTATYDIQKATISGVDGDFYKIVATVNDDTGTFRGYKTTLTFDTSVIVPVSKDTGKDASISGSTVKTPLITAQYYDEENKKDVSAEYTPGYPKWTLSGTTGKLEFESYSTTFFPVKNMPVMQMYFKYAEGKSAKDITDSVFTMSYIHYGNGTDNFYGHATRDNNIVVTNNVVSKSTDLTISVTKDDVIYLQDGTVKTAAATGNFTIPSTDGYVVVNTGYTAQKLYKVASGAVTEVTDNANGVLGAAEASIRNDTFSGLRFKSSFLTALRESIKEYGYLVTVESSYNALPAGYELNMALVTSGKAKKGIGFAKDSEGNITTDISYGVDGARTVVTALATGIPLSKDAVLTEIAARPYYILSDGTVIYGEVTKRTLGEVALSIQQAGGDTYTSNKAYIDSIINLIDDKNAIVDLGPLF